MYSDRDNGLLHGIDVSNWQGSVDWAEHARKGVAFAFVKATEGGDWTDHWFARNWDRMRANWIVCGAYHFARPKGDPEEQARHFLGTIRASGGLRRGDLLALDLETDDGLRPDRVARFARYWCGIVERRTGVRPFVYTFQNFAEDGNCAGLSDYPLWIASPHRPRGRPVVPRPWHDWTIHQHANSPIDRNVFRGGRKRLTRMGFDPR
ncbi:GH25 family lysozyme [Nonomuraea sp. MCN248]|uniref:GH25 family lysozyme n=1 Tax=Nonomuraea corallina TaxID=2989783 RepID=A0ABT4S833_9ACTN|nr:GH25 family lysozyme [Nonomuraea corallina]MDA0633397.1 GH25 family lysozyme [Nonomuraea corallina]